MSLYSFFSNLNDRIRPRFLTPVNPMIQVSHPRFGNILFRAQSAEPSSQTFLNHKSVVLLFSFVCVIDMIEILAVFCFQVFFIDYFPWHFYPMMVNRMLELTSFILSRGPILSLFSIIQIFLSVVSFTIFGLGSNCSEENCSSSFALYITLLVFEIFVAILVYIISKYPLTDDSGEYVLNYANYEEFSQRSSFCTNLKRLCRRISFWSIENRNQIENSNQNSSLSFSSNVNEVSMDAEIKRQVLITVIQPGEGNFAIASPCNIELK